MSLLIKASFLAMAPAPASPAGAPVSASAQYMPFLTMVLILGALYFLMIAPQRKKQKEHEAMLKALKTGDDVVTSAGLFGTITNVKEDRFVIRIADNTKVEIAKGFIQSVVKRGEAEEKK
jgi:preprotein translocase subunit YajC